MNAVAQVVAPETPEVLARELSLAAGSGLGVAPVGGGTQMGLGNPPTRRDLVLKTKNLDRILAYSPEDLTVRVEAGITLQALQYALAKHGQTVAIEAPLPERATIGGILAAGATGPRRFSYGNCREQLIGIRVAHPDGTLTKAGGQVVKNVTGYEMTKLYTGSLGTLGVIVEAGFKLVPLPTVTQTVLASCPSMEAVSDAIRTLLAAHLQPLVVDALNTGATTVVARSGGGGEHAGATWQFGGGETTGNRPPNDSPWLLAVEFGGSQAAVDRQVREAGTILNSLSSPADAAAFWQAVRDFGRSPEEPWLVLRAAVLPSHLAELVAATQQAGPPGAMIARAGNGILNAYWSPDTVGAAEPEAWAETVDRVRTASQRLEGSTVVEDCPEGLKGAVDMWGPPPPGFHVMQRLKRQFDPKGVLNPGRFVGGI
jgi:glycolate oxidase FAD binding subunit